MRQVMFAVLLSLLASFAAVPVHADTLTISAAGELAAGVGPVMQVYAGAVSLGSVEVKNTSPKNFQFTLPTGTVAGSPLYIAFTNDAFISGQDRNLLVYSVTYTTSGGTTASLNLAGVPYDQGTGSAAFDGLNVRPFTPVHMPWNGALYLALPQFSSLTIRASGELAVGVAPTMMVSANGSVVAITSVSNTGTWQDYNYILPSTAVPGSEINIAFTNDAFINGQDRNLLIQSIRIDGTPVDPRGLIYDLGNSTATSSDGLDVMSFGQTTPYMPWGGALRFTLSSGVSNLQMGLVINDADPYSVAVGEYYRVRRAIPTSNVVHLNFPVANELSPEQAVAIKQTVDAALPSYVQGMAIAWKEPHFARCNSITTILSMGFVASECSGSSRLNPFYNNVGTLEPPFAASGIRPSMALAAYNVTQAKALIDRGIAADHTYPTTGSAYLMNTSDPLRSLRTTDFLNDPALSHAIGTTISPYVYVRPINGDSIQRSDIMFYFQGLAVVPNISGNSFMPGAIFDTLSSCTGWIDGGNLLCQQDSILDYIAAGATGTFGTITEPFASVQTFPSPFQAISYYTKGQSLLEAYWHSVMHPAMGLFVGDPLANPWMYGSRYIDQQTPVAPTLGRVDFLTDNFTQGQTTTARAFVSSNQYAIDYPIYELHRQQLGTGTTQTATAIGRENFITFSFNPLPGGVTTATHRFTVYARSANGTTSPSSNAIDVTCEMRNGVGSCTGFFAPPAATPTNVAASFGQSGFAPGQQNTLNITYSPAANAATYWVSVTSSLAPIGTVYMTDQTSYQVPIVPLPAGVAAATYTVLVAGQNADFQLSQFSTPVVINCQLTNGVGHCQ